MNYTILTYLIYTVISLGATVWVARTLFTNGRIFLVEAFGDKNLADAVNTLLAVGFYLVNFGFVAFFLSIGGKPTDAVEMIEYISVKVGIVLFFLGMVHIFNVFNFARIRRKSRRKQPDQPSQPSQPSIEAQPAT